MAAYAGAAGPWCGGDWRGYSPLNRRTHTRGQSMNREPNSGNDAHDGSDATAAGPADHGRDGGMATRENAPELTEPDQG